MSQNPLKQSHTKRKIHQIKILSVTNLKYVTFKRRSCLTCVCISFLWKFPRNRSTFFFFFTDCICLQLGWTQRANSFLENISFEACLFQNKNSYWKHMPEPFQSNWSQKPELSKLQRSPQEIERWRRESAGFSKSSGSPGSAEDTELKWWGSA